MNKQPVSSQDSFVDKLNRFLARLMGKKANKPLPEHSHHPAGVPSNFKFIVIIIAMLVVLWGLTGIYFVPDASYGIVLNNGKISKVVKGMDTGVSLPFPFSDVITLDASSNSVKFGKAAESAAYLVLTADNRQLDVSGEIDYHIQNPQKYYLNYYQETSDLDQRVNRLSKTIIQDYFLHHDANEILRNSNTITGNEIRKTADAILNGYGLSIDKLSINSITRAASESSNARLAANVTTTQTSVSAAVQSLTLAEQLLNQANSYATAMQTQNKQWSTDFNQLLPQYRNSPKIIAELMYYKMLSNVPQTPESYPLLQLTLPQLQSLGDAVITNGNFNMVNDKNPRLLNRNVNRSVLRSRWGSN